MEGLNLRPCGSSGKGQSDKYKHKIEDSFTPLNTQRTKILSDIKGLPFFERPPQMKVPDYEKDRS